MASTRRSARIALLVVGLSWLAAPSPATGQSRAEREVMDVTQAACEAARVGDLDGLERLLAREFTLVGSSGTVQSRAAFLAEVASGDPAYDEFRNHDMTAHVFGDAAIVQGITSLAGRAGGEPFDVDVRFTDTLVRIGGEWRIVVSHATRIRTE